MKLIKANYEIYAASFNKDLPYNYDGNNLIEIAGRTCYKSEEKIADGTADKFVKMIEERGHNAMIEHSWELRFYDQIVPYCKFLNFMQIDNGVFVAGNKRAFKEWDYKYYKDYYVLVDEHVSAIYENKRWDMLSATVKIITDRGVTHEIVRHRLASYAQESTRFCNYSKAKFDGHVTFIIPPWVNIPEGKYDLTNYNEYNKKEEEIWFKAMLDNEQDYNFLISRGWSPQQARSVLPNSLKTEIIVTADLQEWIHIFNLRALGKAGTPHPQMLEIMKPLYKDFQKLFPEVFI